jgi:hypothetical protein
MSIATPLYIGSETLINHHNLTLVEILAAIQTNESFSIWMTPSIPESPPWRPPTDLTAWSLSLSWALVSNFPKILQALRAYGSYS